MFLSRGFCAAMPHATALPNSSLHAPLCEIYFARFAVGRISSSPPLVNNTNPDDKLEFVLFFSNEYFGIKVDLNGKKKNQPGV